MPLPLHPFSPAMALLPPPWPPETSGAPPAQAALERLGFYTSDLQAVLSMPQEAVGPFVMVLRMGGANIGNDPEAERAAVLYWLLGHYLAAGPQWRRSAELELAALRGQLAPGQGFPGLHRG